MLRKALFSLFFVSLFLCNSIGVAEQRVIYGIPFHVEEIVEIDDENTKISLFGTEKIVKPEDVNRTILSFYLSSEQFAERFDLSNIESFLVAAIEAEDVTTVAQIIYRLLNDSSVGLSKKLSLILQLGWSSTAIQGFKEALLLEKSTELGAPGLLMCAKVGVKDLNWIRRNKSSRVLSADDRFFSVVHQLIQNELAGENGDRYFYSIVRLLEEMFGPDHPKVLENTRLLEKITALSELKPSIDRSVLYPYLGRGSTPLETRVLRPLVVERIHDFSNFAVQEGAPGSALILLSELTPTERSEETQELLISSLSALKASDLDFRTNRVVRELLVQESRNNQKVRAAYTRYLRAVFQAEVAQSRLRAAALIREHLREVSLSDQQTYDRMVFEESLEWATRGRNDVADELLQLRSRNISFLEFVELCMSGYYGNPFLILLYLLVPILLFSLLLVRERERRIQEEELTVEEHFEEYAEYDQGTEQVSSEVFSNLRSGGNTMLLEYKKLLAELDLPWQASMAEIKTAYRKKIKTVHPDAHEENATSDAFINLSRMYERILELRKEIDILND